MKTQWMPESEFLVLARAFDFIVQMLRKFIPAHLDFCTESNSFFQDLRPA